MQVLYARALSEDELDEEHHAIKIEGKSWFYVELDNGQNLDLLASDLAQAKQYAIGNYHAIQ